MRSLISFIPVELVACLPSMNQMLVFPVLADRSLQD